MAEPGHTPIPEVTRELQDYKPTLRASARPAKERQSRGDGGPARGGGMINTVPAQVVDNGRGQLKASQPFRNQLGYRGAVMLEQTVPETAASQDEQQPKIDFAEAWRNTPRKVTFQDPREELHPPSETKFQGDQGEEGPRSDKENKNPAPQSTISLVERSPGSEIDEQDTASTSRAPSLAYSSGALPPVTSPEASKHFKPEISRLGQSSNELDALETLKLAAQRDDEINLGSPQGMFTTLRRAVTGTTGGL